MRTLLRWIAHSFGVTTNYHVAATYAIVGGGQAWVSMTCEIRPWLHRGNYPELVAYVETQAVSPTATPSITSIARMGA